MLHPAKILLLAAAVVLANPPAFAQTADAPRHTHKAAKPRKAVATPPAPLVGGINTPSTDFSKVERADEEPKGPNGPTFRPTMGAGGMGLGGAF